MSQLRVTVFVTTASKDILMTNKLLGHQGGMRSNPVFCQVGDLPIICLNSLIQLPTYRPRFALVLAVSVYCMRSGEITRGVLHSYDYLHDMQVHGLGYIEQFLGVIFASNTQVQMLHRAPGHHINSRHLVDVV